MRPFFLLLAVPPFLVLAVLAAAQPDLPGLILAKLSEGGMWTGLAAFLALAIVLSFRKTERPPD